MDTKSKHCSTGNTPAESLVTAAFAMDVLDTYNPEAVRTIVDEIERHLHNAESDSRLCQERLSSLRTNYSFLREMYPKQN